MASKAMWEVDPETRSKLASIQKEGTNNQCCDCNAPSPQWASPKFGVFICLSCAGVHRGLGVHISFVRSISMDAFKQSEIERMRLGGNKGWKDFYEVHPDTQMSGLSWDGATIAERYGGDAGEEWKDRLSAKVEGREYVPGERKKSPKPSGAAAGRQPEASIGGSLGGSRTQSPGGANSGSGTAGGDGSNKFKVDDQYFASLGNVNAARPDSLPPNQGGKYAGFGNSPAPASGGGQGSLPGFDDFGKDPVAAFTKGFGWFSSAVGKTAKSVNSDFIQPTAKQFGESDFAAQARQHASSFGRVAQSGARNAQESFNRFVEGDETGGGNHRQGYKQAPAMDESRRNFWDDFSSLADQRQQESSSIGTAAMGKGGSGRGGSIGGGAGASAGAGTTTGTTGAAPAGKKSGEDWGDDW